jgi:hypothetical protein
MALKNRKLAFADNDIRNSDTLGFFTATVS